MIIKTGGHRFSLLFVTILLIFSLFATYDNMCLGGEANSHDCIGHHDDFFQDVSQPRNIGSVALSDDGKHFAVAVDDRGWSDLFVYDVSTGKLLWKLALPNPASWLALAPFGNALAISFALRPYNCDSVYLINGSDGKILTRLGEAPELSSLKDSTQSVTFSTDGRMLAASTASAVRIWDVSSGRSLSAIEPPGFETRRGIDPIQVLAFSPDGKHIAGASGRWPIVYLWNIKNGRLQRTFRISKFSGGLGNIVFNTDGSLLAAGSTGPIMIWNTHTAKLTNTIPKPPGGPIGPILFLDRTKLLVSGVVDLKVWDVSRRKPVPIQDLRPPGVVMDTVLPISSGRLIGLTSNGAWEKNPDKPLEIQLIEVPSGKVISTMQVPGRVPVSGRKGAGKQE